MSKFFTYEERLDLQKFLKESLSFKEISRRLEKNPTTILRKVRKYSSEVATGYPFNACSVTNIFNQLDEDLGQEIFNKLFPVVLTDNGSEFSNPKAIEYRETKPLLRTNVFYCDAGKPYQKGAIEVNHELIRRVLPKGTNFNRLTQEDINLMMNHINSYKRKKLNNRSPYEVFNFYHGEEVLHRLGCELVPARDIMLKPALLKK